MRDPVVEIAVDARGAIGPVAAPRAGAVRPIILAPIWPWLRAGRGLATPGRRIGAAPVRRLLHDAAMALNATIHVFNIELADADRGVYESLTLRVARHPSEAEDYLLTRVLAYCLETTEGIGFSSGLSSPDEPAIHVRDPTGALLSWIDIGVPDAARIHRASKAAPRVAVYTHKAPEQLRKALAAERIHRADALHLIAVDRDFLAAWVRRLERRMKMSLSVSGGRVYLDLGTETLEADLAPVSLAAD